METFNLIMSCLNGDIEVGRALCNYINACFNIRTQALCEKNEKDIYLRPPLTITHFGRHSIRPKKFDL